MPAGDAALVERITRSVDDYRDELIDVLRRLVAAPSMTGQEGLYAPVCDLIYGWIDPRVTLTD